MKVSALTVAAGVLLGLLAAGPALARCGGVTYAQPYGRLDRAHRPPLAIGDSTMVHAARSLAAAGFEVNARPCRSMNEGLALIARTKRGRRLPRLVLVHLGANHGILTAQVRRAIRIMGPRRVLVMVTPRPGVQASVVRAAGRRWPRRVRVLDWVRAYVGRVHYFPGDGSLHLSPRGVAAFVRLCRTFLPLNRPEPVLGLGPATPLGGRPPPPRKRGGPRVRPELHDAVSSPR